MFEFLKNNSLNVTSFRI